jgi:hypothetical protein
LPTSLRSLDLCLFPLKINDATLNPEHVQAVRHGVHHVILMVFVADEVLQLVDFFLVAVQINATAAKLEVNSIVVVVEDNLSLSQAALEFLNHYLQSLILALLLEQ